jgi:autotransporter-associated beta strand protein
MRKAITRFGLLAGALAVGLIGGRASAATYDWRLFGAGTNQWSASGSWTLATGVPSTSDPAAIINFDPSLPGTSAASISSSFISNNDLVGLQLNVLNLAGRSNGNNNSFSPSLTGNSLTFTNPNAQINNNSLFFSANGRIHYTVGNALILSSTNLTISHNAQSTANMTFTGGLTGNGDLVINDNSQGAVNFTTAAINNTGTITNSGTGTGTVTISGGIGPNVSAVTLNSLTSALTINTTAISVHATATTLTNTSGTKILTLSAGTTGTGNLILDNDSSTAAGIVVSSASSSTINHDGNVSNVGSGSGSVTLSSPMGALVKGLIQNSSTSELLLSGSNTAYTGSVTITAGTIRLGSGTALNLNNTVSIKSGGTLELNNNSEVIAGLSDSAGSGGVVSQSGANARTLTLGGSGTNTFSGSLTATTPANLALTVNLTGGGSQTLTGTLGYTGATLVSGGTLNIGAALANSAVTVNGATSILTLSATGAISQNTLTLTNGTLNTTATNAISGTTAVVLNGATSIANLNLANSYSGATTIATGVTVNIGNSGSFGSSTLTMNLANISASNPGVNVANNYATTLNSAVTTFTGTNSLTLSGTQSSNVTHTFQNNITGGTLTLSGTQNLSTSTSNFTFTLSGSGNTVISGAITNGTSTALLGNLAYTGSGSLNLSNANLYGGTTNHTGTGTLNLSGSLNSSSVTVNNALAVLNIQSSNAIIKNAVTLTAGTINIGAANGISGTGVLTANAGTVNLVATGAISVNALTLNNAALNTTALNALSGTASLAINNSAVDLQQANDYSGGTTITNATLSIADINRIGSGNVTLNAGGVIVDTGATDITAFGGRITAAAVGTVALDTSTSSAIDLSTINTASLGAIGNVTVSGAITPSSTIYRFGGGGGTLTVDSLLSSGNSVAAANAGTVILTNTGNTFSGAAAYNGGTLRPDADTLPGGALAVGGALGTVGASNQGGGHLDLTNVGDYSATSFQATNTSGTSTVTIASGKTLTVTGTFTLGTVNTALTTNVTFAGGTLEYVNAAGTANIASTINNGSTATVNADFTGLAEANITANLLNIGNTVQSSTATLHLSSGTNLWKVGTVTIGKEKGSAVVDFTTANGSLTIRGTNGTSPATLIELGRDRNFGTSTATVDLNGHTVDILATTISLSNAVARAGSYTSTFSFDQGTVTTTSLLMAQKTTDTSGLGSLIAGIMNVGGTGVLNVGSGGILLGKKSGVGGAAGVATAGTLNINGGTVNVGGNITDGGNGGGANPNTSTLNLNGGTLNMGNFAIGDSTNPIDNLILASGTLSNVLQVNGGGGITKTTAGVLTVAGTNSYSGGTTVSTGEVIATGTLGVGNVTVADEAILDLRGSSLISDGATLVLDTGAVAQLNFSGIETVGNLSLGGVLQAVGTYGATGSGALFTDDTFFSGTGVISVPEPTGLGLLAVGVVGLLKRRRAK